MHSSAREQGLEQLYMWVIYDHPKDHPNNIVARKWQIGEGVYAPTGLVLLGDSLDGMRQCLIEEHGMVAPLARKEGDDPVIIESWV
jgi:hypothetical protein